MNDVEQQPCIGHLDSSLLMLQSLPVWWDDIAGNEVACFAFLCILHMEMYTNWVCLSPILFAEHAGAKQLMWLVRAGVCADRPVVSVKVQEIAPLTLHLFSARLSLQLRMMHKGRQLRPHREDWLFSSVQCVFVCVCACHCWRLRHSSGWDCTVLIGRSM